jgi:hypothetical protein
MPNAITACPPLAGHPLDCLVSWHTCTTQIFVIKIIGNNEKYIYQVNFLLLFDIDFRVFELFP